MSQNTFTDQLPASLEKVADVIGRPAALELSRQFGRQRLYFPMHLPDGHAIVAAIGRDAADKLVTCFGGEHYDVPSCAATARERRNSMIRRLRREGLSMNEISARVGLTVRQVREILRQG